MKEMPRITEAEWVVMKVFWQKSPQTANEAVNALQDSNWNPKTIRTLINRLQKKKALGYEKDGRHYRYFSLIQEDECVLKETNSLFSRAGTAVLKPMLAALLREQKLSAKEIAELKEILDHKKEK